MASLLVSRLAGPVLARTAARNTTASAVCASALHTLSKSLYAPRVGQVSAPSIVSQAVIADIGAVRHDSTKRKRAKKMNKHKYQKMKKRMRNLNAKNVKS